MIVPQTMLCDLEKDLKRNRLVVKRHKAILALLEKKPEAFLDTNGRALIRAQMMTAVGECVRIETAIIELQKAAGKKPARRRSTDARM